MLKRIPVEMARSRRIYVVNLDPSTSGKGGTHWIAVSTLDPEFAIVFDPFGVEELPFDVLEWCKKYRRVVYVNTNSVQDLTTESCGYFSLFVLDGLLKGKRFTDVLASFSPDRMKNESLLKSYFYGYKK